MLLPFVLRWLTALRARVGFAIAGLWGCGGGGSTTVFLLWRLQFVSERAGIGFGLCVRLSAPLGVSGKEVSNGVAPV